MFLGGGRRISRTACSAGTLVFMSGTLAGLAGGFLALPPAQTDYV